MAPRSAAAVTLSADARAVSGHHERWGAPDIVSRAPGRVNLIGEHTDYNDGFALPMALPFDTVVALSTSGDGGTGAVSVVASGFGEVTIDPTAPFEGVPAWARHLAGIVAFGPDAGLATGGWRAVVETDIPTGASLSSSAALEVAVILALAERSGTTLTTLDVARLGQRVEREAVGLPGGLMDQMISAGAVAGHASLLDCRALTLDPVAVPDDLVVAVLDTGTRRVLADSAYADRQAACARAVAELGVVALRDVAVGDLRRVSDPVDRQRARHVVTENQRTLDAATALAAGNGPALGKLMTQSHVSLRDDYQVSGAGLDAIVAVAQSAPGCLGARMTGGGFAGCAVALVARDAADAFADHVVEQYSHEGHQARVWVCDPAPGASLIH